MNSTPAVLMSKCDAAKLIGVCVSTIEARISERKLGCHKVGRRVLISAKQIEQFLASTEIAPTGSQDPQ